MRLISNKSKHKKSETHQVAIQNEHLATAAVSKGVSIETLGVHSTLLAKTAMLTRICAVFFLVSNHDSMSRLEQLTTFFAIAGLQMNVTSKFDPDKALMYCDRTFFRQILATMAFVIQSDVLKAMALCPFYALMGDEGVDHRKLIQLLLYYKFYDRNLKCVRQVFAGIYRLSRGTSDNMMSAIQKNLIDNEIDIMRIGWWASDGAAAMLGSVGGISTQLKTLVSYLLIMHCVCHRSALAAKDSIKNVPYLKKVFFSVLEAIGKHYWASGSRTAALFGEQAALGFNEACIGSAAFARWLSLAYVVSNILKHFPALLNDLRKRSQGVAGGEPDYSAAGFYNIFNSYEFCVFLLLSHDVLPLLAHLNVFFQSVTCDYTQLDGMLLNVYTLLEKWKTQDSPSLRNLPTFREQLKQWDHQTPFVYQGFRQSGVLRNAIRRWLTDLIDCLKQRFPHVKLLESFAILFSPRGWPIRFTDDNYTDFGEKELEFILENLYGLNSQLPSERKKIYDNCFISFSVAFEEWRNLRAYLVANQSSSFPVKNVTDTLQFIINREGEFPIMTRLAHVPVVGAASTAAVERGVFCMNQTKTKHSALLSQESLMNSMVVAINGPKTVEEFRNKFAVTVLHTWGDKRTLRHVDIGESTSLSMYGNANEKLKVMIRTGKTADGIGQGKKRNKTVAGGSVDSTALDGDRPSWSFNLGRFGTDSKKGSAHQFVSDSVHTQSTMGMNMSTTTTESTEEDFEGIMNADEGTGPTDEGAGPIQGMELQEEELEEEEEDLVFLKAMDTYEANAVSIDECISVAGKMLDDIPVMIPKDKADSGIFDPAYQNLVFDKVAAIPAGVSYGQTRSGRNVRNPLDKRRDVVPTGTAKIHGLAQ